MKINSEGELKNMPICPECKEQIVYLGEDCWVRESTEFSINDTFEPEWNNTDISYDEVKDKKWYCPECYETLFIKQDDAVQFLKCELLYKKINPNLPTENVSEGIFDSNTPPS